MTSIIILVQDRYEMFKRCIDSILKYTQSPYEFVFIVQGKVDRRILDLIDSIPNCRVIYNEVNIGVTPGRNQGIEAATGEYLLFFDDDAYIDENTAAMIDFYKKDNFDLDWLGRMRMYFADPSVGIVGPTGSYINPGRKGVFWVFPDSEGCECDVVQGYCFMFSRKVVEEVGKLDPYYGKFWHEESDYALNAKYHGFKVINTGYIGVFHLGSGSGDDGSFGTKLDYLFNKWSPFFDQILEITTWREGFVVPTRNIKPDIREGVPENQ